MDMSLLPGNVAAVFMNSLQKIRDQGNDLVLVAESAPMIYQLGQVCIVFSDAAESIAEATASPELRDSIFSYAKEIRNAARELAFLANDISLLQNGERADERTRYSIGVLHQHFPTIVSLFPAAEPI
jgi:hypothetical protein